MRNKVLPALLALALVLCLAGCAQDNELSVDEHTEKDGDAYTHVWNATYENGDYIRSALQFGSGNVKVTKAKVQVDLKKATDGKAGLLFGLNTRDVDPDGDGETTTVYDFYAVAFGKNQNAADTLEAYIDYYQGLTTFQDTGDALAAEKFGTGQNFVVKTTSDLSKTWDGSSAVTAYIAVEYDEDADTYDVYIQNSDGTEKYWSAEDITAETVTGVDSDAFALSTNVGKMYSYGMLSGRVDPKTADTTWTIDRTTFVKSGGSMAAADAE